MLCLLALYTLWKNVFFCLLKHVEHTFSGLLYPDALDHKTTIKCNEVGS